MYPYLQPNLGAAARRLRVLVVVCRREATGLQGCLRTSRPRKMTCAENPPPSLLKQDGLCTQGLYCWNQSWEIETGGGVCENVSASWFDTLKKKGWKKLPLDWKMEIDVECWLFFFYVHPYARMGTLRRSHTKAKTEETHAGEGAPEFS